VEPKENTEGAAGAVDACPPNPPNAGTDGAEAGAEELGVPKPPNGVDGAPVVAAPPKRDGEPGASDCGGGVGANPNGVDGEGVPNGDTGAGLAAPNVKVGLGAVSVTGDKASEAGVGAVLAGGGLWSIVSIFEEGSAGGAGVPNNGAGCATEDVPFVCPPNLNGVVGGAIANGAVLGAALDVVAAGVTPKLNIDFGACSEASETGCSLGSSFSTSSSALVDASARGLGVIGLKALKRGAAIGFCSASDFPAVAGC
jgi:hypothetical protein